MSADQDARSAGRVSFFEMYHYCINMDRATVQVMALLWKNSAALGIIKRGQSTVRGSIRRNPVYAFIVITLRCIAAKLRRAFGLDGERLYLPDRGEVAVLCFPDYVRIFDLKNCRITNVFQGIEIDVASKYAHMLDLQKRLASTGIAPKIYIDETSRNSYVEEYCPGMLLHEAQWWRGRMFEKIHAGVDMVQRCMSSREGRVNDIANHVEEEIEALRDACPGSFDNADCGRIRSVLENAREEAEPEEQVELTVSHGDLARRNVIVRTDDSIVFIDWQTVDYRARDYDIYNYCFSLIQDEGQEVLYEEEIFKYLSASLNAGPRWRANLAGYTLCLLNTRFSHFLLPSTHEPARVVRGLTQLVEYLEIIERYAHYAEARLSQAANP